MMYEADLNDSPLWQLMVSIRSELAGLDYSPRGEDLVGRINPESIHIRKLGFMPGVVTTTDQVPGLIITPPSTVTTPWEGGTNVEVESRYPILIQLIAPDTATKVAGLRTWSKWLNNIARHLSSPNLQLTDYNAEADDAQRIGFEISQATQVYVLDPQVWIVHKQFQGGVVVDCVIRESIREMTL